jgi:hypothetical protein
MRPEPFKKWTRPPRLRNEWLKHMPRGVRLSFSLCASPVTAARWQNVHLSRDGPRLTVNLCSRDRIEEAPLFYYYRTFLPVALHLFSRASQGVAEAVVDITDGSSSPSDHLVFSANYEDALLVPDPEFFNARAYEALRRQLGAQRPWSERSDKIVYRCATSGEGLLPHEASDLAAEGVLQRLRLCAMLSGAPGTDAKVYRVVQSADPQRDEAILRAAGLMGAPIPFEHWLGAKFAIDIDGNTNAWSNLYTRLLLGCCVLKVASPLGFRQWYYDDLQPFVNYVPIRADLADLQERIDWCRSNPAASAAIANAGQALALSMTFTSEMARGTARINERLGGHRAP